MEIAFISLCIILILVELIKGLSANGTPVRISSATAPTRNAVIPPIACGGDTVLISAPTIFSPYSLRIKPKPSSAVAPPHVGVQTPGAHNGSKKSM